MNLGFLPSSSRDGWVVGAREPGAQAAELRRRCSCSRAVIAGRSAGEVLAGERQWLGGRQLVVPDKQPASLRARARDRMRRVRVEQRLGPLELVGETLAAAAGLRRPEFAGQVVGPRRQPEGRVAGDPR